MGRILLKNFLTDADKREIEAAVASAEKKTSGEIVILVVQKSRKVLSVLTDEAAVEQRARKAFLSTGIQNTHDRTGVLIMISLDERMVNVKADKDVHDKVKADTWQTTVNVILDGIKDNRAAEGICRGIEHAGEILAEHFPARPNDRNELPDGVLYR